MTDHAETIRRGIWVLDNDDVCSEADIALDALLAERDKLLKEAYDVALILDSARAERQQAIEALREIVRYFEQWDDTRQHPAYLIARAALEKLGEQP